MRRVMSLAASALIALALVPQSVLAENWGGGVGVPGWEPFHWRYWAPHWGSRYSYPGAADYQVPGIVPYWENPAPVSTRSAHVINPAENGASLTFFVGGRQFVLLPGTRQQVDFVPGQTIKFDRGPGRSFAEYSLEDTSYTFTPSRSGWELYRTIPTASSPITAGRAAEAGYR